MFYRNIFPFLFLISIFPMCIYAQSNPIEGEIVEQTIEGIEAVSRNAIAAAFIPMADYDKGDLLFIGSPGYLGVREVYQNPVVAGNPLNGATLGVGAGYALNNKFMVYGILTGLFLKGSLEADYYSKSSVSAETQGSIFSLFTGFGYEVIESDIISIPLFLGLNGGFYNLNIIYPEYSESPYNFSAETAGSGFLGGASGGIAARIKYKSISLTPYYLHMLNFNGANFTTNTDLDSWLLSDSYEINHSIDPYQGGYFGTTFSVKTKSGWFYNLSLKNLIPSLSKKDDSIDFTAFILSVGYNM